MMRAEEVKKQVMNHYSDLKSKGSIEQKYPELNMEDGKKHVLFVQCLLERVSFYRTYLPYLILNDSDTHSAIVASIQKRDFNKSFQDYDVFLQLDLIRWADIIVFPALFFDCKKMFSSILAINSNIRFMMDLDELHLSKSNPKSKNEGIREINPTLIENFRFTHRISCSSSKLVKLYEQEFSERYTENNKVFVALPTFLVSSYLEKRLDEPIERSSIIKIGLQEGWYNQNTLESISKAAIAAKKDITLCIYGNKKQEFNYPKNLRVDVVKAVKFLDYFMTIGNMKLDFVIIEGNNKLIEPQRAIFQYGELALLSIPLICDESIEGRIFIKEKVNGFVITEDMPLEEQLKTIFQDVKIAHKAGKAAQGMALKHLSWNAERAKQLVNIYQ